MSETKTYTFRHQGPINREFIGIWVSRFQPFFQALFTLFYLIRVQSYIVSTPDHTPTVIVHTAATPPSLNDDLLTSAVRHWQPLCVMGCAHNLPYGYVIERDVVQLKRAI
jgi:hypothetical protein